MKKFLSIALILTLVLAMFTGVSFANDSNYSAENETYEAIKGQLIVSVEPVKSNTKPSIQNNDSLRSEEATLKKKGFVVVESLHSEAEDNSSVAFSDDFNAEVIDNMGLVYLVEYSQEDYKSSNKAMQEIKKELKALGFKVRYVSENYIMSTLETGETLDLTTQDLDVNTQDLTTQDEISLNMHNNQRWHYEMIKAPQAWTITQGSSAVRMAVLDTGIDHNHPSLRNFVNTSLGRSFVGGTTLDVNGHGTHVAGTIASYGVVSGVMRNATLIPVKVLGNDGRGSLFGIQQGILYASSIGADVINMSLGGGGYVQGMDDACRTAVSRGTIVVAATGNNGVGSISYPAAYSSVIAVGSVTSSRARSSFSNYGSGLELMAPGSSIYSTWPNSRYNTISGTSMATPHVAGVAGLIRSANRNISVADARNILRNTAQPAGSFTQYGYGIVDAHAAVLAARR